MADRDHVFYEGQLLTCAMHAHAMGLFKKQHASSVCEYAPIAAALLMDDATREQAKRYSLHSDGKSAAE